MLQKIQIVIACLFTIFFFTSLLESGMPQELPIAVVDEDQSALTQSLEERLRTFQSTRVVAHYPTASEAREAMQSGEIFGFIHFPVGFAEDLMSGRQPKLSYYFNSAIYTGGVLSQKDLKVLSTLAKAAVGQSTLRAKGLTDEQAMAILQPVKLQAHQTGNPWGNYNIYISTMAVPGVLILLTSLLMVYYMPRAAKAFQMSSIAAFFLFFFQFYLYGVLKLPHEGSWWVIMLITLLLTGAIMGFALFVFALVPQRRMAMSICSLWGVMSFSMSGAAFPVPSMHPLLQGLSYLFPLRHYFMAYQMNVLHGYDLADSYVHLGCMVVFAALPLLVFSKLLRQVRHFVYIE